MLKKFVFLLLGFVLAGSAVAGTPTLRNMFFHNSDNKDKLIVFYDMCYYGSDKPYKCVKDLVAWSSPNYSANKIVVIPEGYQGTEINVNVAELGDNSSGYTDADGCEQDFNEEDDNLALEFHKGANNKVVCSWVNAKK